MTTYDLPHGLLTRVYEAAMAGDTPTHLHQLADGHRDVIELAVELAQRTGYRTAPDPALIGRLAAALDADDAPDRT
jgi:hypothetical protein